MVVNASSGVVHQYMEHDEFGVVLQDTHPGLTPFGFAGGLYSPESGLIRFGARDYDSESGRWLSKDPIRFNGNDTNLYGYVLQDPINFIDPLGKAAVLPGLINPGGNGGAIGGVIGGTIGGAIGGGNGLDPNADVVPRDLQNPNPRNSCTM